MTPFELMFGTKIKGQDDDLLKMIEKKYINLPLTKTKKESKRINIENTRRKIRNYNKKRKKANLNKIGDLFYWP